MRNTIATLLSLSLTLSACGGGGGSGSVVTPPPTGSAPTPTPVTTAGCSLRERQDWAAAQLREWYLFPETLPASLSPTPYATVSDYVDALTATARGQGRDRYFTYLTSIAEENAYYSSGSSAGFGFRLAYDSAAGRVFVAEAFEGTPALSAGIDRGAEITAIGTSASDLRAVSAIMASGGAQAVSDALGPSTVGTTRTLRVVDATGTYIITMAKADYTLTPVSSRYGAKILDDGGRKVGYVNLRTFISTADPALRTAFGNFKAAGITEVIVDLRYNGGGLVSTAQLMGDLMGANRTTSDVFDYMAFRPEKAAENETRFFQPKTESIAPTKIAFIGTGGTASASELVVNAFIPYLHANAALIGTNTYGKPVGQIALDRAACDDRLRVIAFATQNAARQGNYFNGLAGTVEASCRAGDDVAYPLGDPRESSTKAALDFLAGRSCTAITSGSQSTLALRSATTARELLTPERPSTVQREVPGAF
ncbi:S41 family peptidase [Sphingomonas psychrotolerans]|uniref:S41 family peptidase n=1 Tax=Sphingomonas psychrotolerans TaxID=1327635 RepID=A0ABU3N867_9SPHN|nr:S41 family peptidase [Sphingomonas psychrotolerans]MDT8759992.1 S41 family peptidase [Sphingomonas psychrotolerans]